MATIVTAPPAASQAADTRSAVARGIGIGIGAIALVVGAWIGYSAWRDSQATGPATVATPLDVPAAEPATAIDPHQLARAQIAADRIAQPAGDNAIETYLGILQSDPADTGVRQALVEMLPLVNDLANAAADAGATDELARLIGLLERVDSGYAQLPRLKQRQAELVLQAERAAEVARRELMAQQQETVRAAAVPAPPAAVPTPAATAAASPRTPAVSAPAQPVRNPASATPAAATIRPDAGRLAVAAPPPAGSAASITPPTSQRVAIVDPVLLKRVEPRYPAQALARRLEGFVEVELSISASGQTTDVRVIRAEPNSPLFTREALRVARDWRYQPKTVDGVPTATTVRQRLNFRMPRG